MLNEVVCKYALYCMSSSNNNENKACKFFLHSRTFYKDKRDCLLKNIEYWLEFNEVFVPT